MSEDIPVRVNQEQLPQDSPQEQLGEVALSDEQRALTMLNSDPTHPRGNEELAEEMAHAGEEHHQAVVDVHSGAKPDIPAGSERFFGDGASRLENEAQEKYLERHPEKVKQRDEEGLDLETQQWRKDNWVDEKTAWEMFDRGYGELKHKAEVIKKNLSNSGVESESAKKVLEDLETNAEQVEKEAVSDVLHEEKVLAELEAKESRRFTDIRDTVVQKVLGIVSGAVPIRPELPDGKSVLNIDATWRLTMSKFVEAQANFIRFDRKEISVDHVYELRELIYSMLGAEAPKSEDFDYKTNVAYLDREPKRLERFLDRISSTESQLSQRVARVVTPGNLGFSVVETRDGHVNPGETSPTEIEKDKGGVRLVRLSIVPTEGVREEDEQKAA